MFFVNRWQADKLKYERNKSLFDVRDLNFLRKKQIWNFSLLVTLTSIQLGNCAQKNDSKFAEKEKSQTHTIEPKMIHRHSKEILIDLHHVNMKFLVEPTTPKKPGDWKFIAMGHDRWDLQKETSFYLSINLAIGHKRLGDFYDENSTYPPAVTNRIEANSVVIDVCWARRPAKLVEARRQSFHLGDLCQVFTSLRVSLKRFWCENSFAKHD